MYIPNHEKWLDYYEKMIKHKHSTPIPGAKSVAAQEEGGLTTLSNQFIIPIEKRHNVWSSNEAKQIKLISPSQQTVQQAQSEIERTEMKSLKKRRQRKRKLNSNKGAKLIGRKIIKHKNKKKKINNKPGRQKKGSLKNIFV